MRCVLKYLCFLRWLMYKSQERLHNENSVIFGLTRFVHFSKSEVLNIVCYKFIRNNGSLRSLKAFPIFLSHHDVPLISAKMPIFNDVDSPSLILFISALVIWLRWEALVSVTHIGAQAMRETLILVLLPGSSEMLISPVAARGFIFKVLLFLKVSLLMIRYPLIIGSLLMPSIGHRRISGGTLLLVIKWRVLSDLIPIAAVPLVSLPPMGLHLVFLYGDLIPRVCVLDGLAWAHDDRLYLIVHLLKVCGIISADLNCFSSWLHSSFFRSYYY